MIKTEMEGLGFKECSTGGGCVAWIKEWPNTAQVLITLSSNEGYLPDEDDSAVDVGFYDKDGQQTGWAPFPTLRYALDNMEALILANMEHTGLVK